MKLNSTISIFFLAFTLPVLAAEEVKIDYSYDGEVRADFSNMTRGPLRVGEFSDSRDGGNPREIDSGSGNFTTAQPLADLVRDALVQGLEKGNAALVESGENMTLVGSLVASELQQVDNGGVDSYQLTLRTRVQLQGSGRTIWETVLFGRGTAPIADGVGAALSGALDRTIRSLVQDDYFLIEL